MVGRREAAKEPVADAAPAVAVAAPYGGGRRGGVGGLLQLEGGQKALAEVHLVHVLHGGPSGGGGGPATTRRVYVTTRGDF